MNFDLRRAYAVLRGTGAVSSMTQLDEWLGQRPGYLWRGGPTVSRKAALPALMRLAKRLDSLTGAVERVPAVRDLRAALAAEIAHRVTHDVR
ncbi:hypothetical protein [Azospirillum brasilense]|uniref:hypothetical protein n=1 Tax=Azospirillum brasilense TaxID=192 RepID=UPI0010C11B17|nr:hypothetical protein [Azospirillum brasilense]